MNRILITGLLGVYLLFSQGRAESGTIRGQIFSDEGKPLADVHIALDYNNHGAVTKDDGLFLVSHTPIGTYRVRVSHVGFHEIILAGVAVAAGDTTDLGRIVMESKITELQLTVVTASRQEQKSFDVPVTINLIDRKTIERREPNTTAEALREESGVFVQKTNHGGGSAIIRGMSSNQILILVDGIRLNNAVYRLGNHQYLTTVDQNAIEQIEIIHGPTSVLYGSDALGGVINLRTKTPRFLKRNYELHYTLFGRYSNVDHGKMANGRLSFSNAYLNIEGGLSLKNFDDLQRGQWNPFDHRIANSEKNRQSPSGYNAYDWDVHANFQAANSHILSLVHQSSRQTDIPRYDKYENNGYYRWLYTPQNRDLSYLRYQISNPFRYFSHINLSLSRHVQKEGRLIQKEPQSLITNERDIIVSHGIILQTGVAFNRHLINSGLEFYFDDVDSKRFFEDPATGRQNISSIARYPDGSLYNSYGFYLRDDIALNNKFNLIPGVRFTHINANYTAITDTSSAANSEEINSIFNALTSSLNLQYKANNEFIINLNLGQGFRAPNLSDFSKFGQSKGATFEIPNSNLKPEKMYTIDISTKIESPRYRYDFSVYFNSIHDLISSAEDQLNGASEIEWQGQIFKIKSKQNIGKAFITGFEASVRHEITGPINVKANLAYTYGQNITNKEPVGGIPPLFGLVGFEWKRDCCNLELFSRFATAQNRLSADDRDDPRIDKNGTPGWCTLNLRFSYRIKNRITIGAGIENIMDLNYREHGSGINAPGRNIGLSFRIEK